MQAGWTPREFRFTYQGFTAKYSCDGLSGRIKEVLLLLGARKQDLNVAPTGCSGGFGQADTLSRGRGEDERAGATG